jgi:hypothetical protein
MKMPKPKDKAFWLIIIGYALILVAVYKLGTSIIEKRQMVHAARETLETPDLTKGMCCPSGYETLPPVEPALPEP